MIDLPVHFLQTPYNAAHYPAAPDTNSLHMKYYAIMAMLFPIIVPVSYGRMNNTLKL